LATRVISDTQPRSATRVNIRSPWELLDCEGAHVDGYGIIHAGPHLSPSLVRNLQPIINTIAGQQVPPLSPVQLDRVDIGIGTDDDRGRTPYTNSTTLPTPGVGEKAYHNTLECERSSRVSGAGAGVRRERQARRILRRRGGYSAELEGSYRVKDADLYPFERK